MNVLFRIDKKHSVLKKFALSKKKELEMRPIMGRVCVDAKRGYMVATDGRQLAAIKTDMRLNKGDMEKIGLATISTLLCGDTGFIELDLDERGVQKIKPTNGTEGTENTYAAQRYPNWHTVFPSLSNDLHLIITKEGLKKLGVFMKELRKFPRNTNECHRMIFHYQSYDRHIHVTYDDVEDIRNHREVDIEVITYLTETFAFGISVEYVMNMGSLWNGSFWFADINRAVTFDTDDQDTFLIMPIQYNEQPSYKKGQDVKYNISWEKRYTYLEDNQEAINPNNQSINQFTFMDFYTLDRLASGDFEVRGEDNKLARRNIQAMAAHMQRDAKLFRKVQEKLNAKFGTGEQARKLFPLPMDKLYTAIKNALEQSGADLTAILTPHDEQQDSTKPVTQPVPQPVHQPEPVQNTDPVPHNEPEPQPEPDPDPQPNDITITRSSEVVGSKFYPLLIVTTEGETFRVAGNGMYNAIASGDGTITRENQLLFDSIDAFITDALINQNPMDEEAIFNEMAEFFQMVDEASQLVNHAL